MLPKQLSNYVVLENDCWQWQGVIDKDGYGKVYYNGGMNQAHRVVYEITNNVVLPSHIHVHHEKCTLKSCVNPEHMKELDSQRHNFKKSKIDLALGMRIIELYATEPAYKVAQIVGLSTTTVTKYLRQTGNFNRPERWKP